MNKKQLPPSFERYTSEFLVPFLLQEPTEFRIWSPQNSHKREWNLNKNLLSNRTIALQTDNSHKMKPITELPDLTISCAGRDFQVHSRIVCPESRFFDRACNGEFLVGYYVHFPHFIHNGGNNGWKPSTCLAIETTAKKAGWDFEMCWRWSLLVGQLGRNRDRRRST